MTTMRDIVAKHVPNAPFVKRSKYRNRKTTVDGLVFDSMAEAKRYGELKLLERAGEIKGLKRQVVINCVVNDRQICKYLADFTYQRSNGEHVAEDVKGFETALFRLKAKLVEACQGIKIQLVKVRR